MIAARSLRRFSTTYKQASSDDEFLYTNDPIQSTHQPKSQTTLRRAFRGIAKLALITGAGLFTYTYYKLKKSEMKEDDPLVFDQMLGAVKWVDNSIVGWYKVFTDPPVEKLLPDMPPPPPGYLYPKTLVLDLKGTIISADYRFGQGFEVVKRPGLTEFLGKLSQMYEVVIYGEEDFQFTHQIAEGLDPRHRIFSARLGRESVCLRKGEVIKDLSYLNRDLKNIIVVEKNPERVKFHPDNVIILPEFFGDENDRSLIELLPFLEHIAKDRVPDVREEIEKYGHYNTGKKYREQNIAKLQQLQAKQATGFRGLLGSKRTSANEPGPVYDISGTSPKPEDLNKR